MVFHWNLSHNKSPQVSRTLLNILTVLTNAVIWMIFSRPPTSKSSSSFKNPLVVVPKSTNHYWYNRHFHVPQLFQISSKVEVLILFFLHSFSFILWSAGTAKFTILQILFFLLIIIRSGLQSEIR